jgi:adenine-specific DNA-methyltransferase
MAARKKNSKKSIETLTHEEASRKNIPTAEYQSVMDKEQQKPIKVAYERRNRDLDPQLVWRGKDEQDWSDLVVNAPPLYIQEKVHPKVLIDDLKRRTETIEEQDDTQIDLFSDFNGVPDDNAKTEFYQHDQHWSNRMILGDSLQVMASLAEREGLRGKVQCIYFDPPYGIKFNSNFQWSTTSRDVKDGKFDHITREPEQVKAFRDTWRDGIHSYLTYLRDRLTVSRDLLSDTGSIFVQIGEENYHRIRSVLDEIFGDENSVSTIVVAKTSSQTSRGLPSTCDFILWYAKNKVVLKYRNLYTLKNPKDPTSGAGEYKNYWRKFGDYLTEKQKRSFPENLPRFRPSATTSQSGSDTTRFSFKYQDSSYKPGNGGWKTNETGFNRLAKSDRLLPRKTSISYVRFLDDFPVMPISDLWADVRWGFDAIEKRYVVETNPRVIQRCILMATDPGDLVLDPTCGSGTTAHVSEQWGRRWITIDTSRVSLALARARIMGAKYPYYLLADSPHGQIKEAEITRTEPSSISTQSNIRQGFVNQRVPHITLKSIANNTEIDVIWNNSQKDLEPLRKELNQQLEKEWNEWDIPREPGDPWPEKEAKLLEKIHASDTEKKKLTALKKLNDEQGRSFTLDNLPENPFDYWNDKKAVQIHEKWWQLRIERQKEIDASIAAKAEFEYLYDKPYEDNKKVRVAGPFTVESLSPHRVLGVDEHGELIDPVKEDPDSYEVTNDFTQMILENLKTAGVQQAHKEDKIDFSSIKAWPGYLICAEGFYMEGDEETGTEKRAAIFIGPEFGTVQRADLVAAAKEAGDADFDTLIACAFNYEAHATEFEKLGRIPVLKARMNADLHMADDLKNTGKGNLFVIFGEPDIDILEAEDDQIRVKVNGVDVFHPNTGEVRSDGADGIACWFVDTDYNEESFFVRHAYFLGANDPYKSLKTTLKAEISQEAWESLHSDTSRPFIKPKSGRIAVKVINHLGDEVMKVFGV